MSIAMAKTPDTQGPYTVWTNYGLDGWSPTSYETLAEALMAPKYGDFTITRPVEVGEISPAASGPGPSTNDP